MKPLTLAVCVTVIAALVIGTCGCTSSSNTASKATATPTAKPTEDTRPAADNLAGAITARWKELNWTVNTPFTMTKEGDKITYHGVVTNSTNPIVPWSQDVTITLTKSQSTAIIDVYDPAVAAAKARGMSALGYSWSIGLWGANRQTTVYAPIGQGSTGITLYDPQANLIIDWGKDRHLYGVNVGGYYQVIVTQDIPRIR